MFSQSELTLTTQPTYQHHVSNKMRQYTIVPWILLALPVFHFALAAPLAVWETLEVRSNPVEALKDGITTWEKRVDHPGNAPRGSGEGVPAEGPKGDQVWGSEWPWNPEEWTTLGVPSYKNPPKEKPDDKGQLSMNDAVPVSGGGNQAMQSPQGPAENMSPAPQSEHPAPPEYMSPLEKFFKEEGKYKLFRPRDSSSGVVDTPKRESKGNILTMAT